MTDSSTSAVIPVRIFSSARDTRALVILPPFAVAASGGFFQIRPQKDFRPERGRNNLLSLRLLSDLPEEILDTPEPDVPGEPRNAYEFMQRRRITGDPTLKRWNASIRMSNFAILDTSPFAVGPLQTFFFSPCRCLV
jgi:DNA mismatch repair protein MSH5